MRLRNLLLACFCFGALQAAAQVTFSPSAVNFFTVYQGSPSTINVTLNNGSATDMVVTDIDLYHGDAFTIQDTAFTVPAGGGHTFAVTCDPRHNVRYADWLLVKSSTHPYVAHAFVYAFAKYNETYYDATQNLYDEALETALRTTISTGYVPLGYDDARDKMFMIIDNELVNGQGASQNTLECVYTGYLAVGYGNRGDAQTNFNLNTEHTMPQSLFSSNPPMVSDIHHLFVVTETSNSERGNNPFGVVNNPSWQQGGSKSNGSIFEPRDAQKGATARALLYFYLRYQDYQGFICNMEPLLRTWNADFAPDSVDVTRNDDIEFFQHNRNPFVDHPEFMERITNLCGTGNADPSPIADWVADTLVYGSVSNGSSLDGYYAISNHGTNAMTLSNLGVSSPEFTILGSPSLTVPKDSLRKIWVRFTPTGANQNYSATLSFDTDAPNTPTRSVHLMGNSFPVGVAPSIASLGVKLYPQPAQGRVWLDFQGRDLGAATVHIVDLVGQRVASREIAQGQSRVALSLEGLARGLYFVQLELGGQSFTEKLLVE